MAKRTRPPFRADHVGSLLRPDRLLEMRKKVDAGRADAAELEALENECITELVKFQEDIGLESVTDGEFRRGTFHGDFLGQLENVEFKQVFPPGETGAGGHEAPFVAVVTDKLKRPAGGIEVQNFKFLQGLTSRTAKQTIPSPTMTHFRGGREAISEAAYPDLSEFFVDLARVYREEIAELGEAGCRYLQFDDTNLAYMCDEEMREQAIARGEDLEQLPYDYAKLINESISSRPDDMAVCIHLCRGNAKSRWFAEGGYEPVAEVIFNEMKVDGLFLEYDDWRSGDFAPLRFVPKDKVVVLGLVSTKWPDLEDPDILIRRIEDASQYCPIEQLCLSPQCGFASVSEGNEITVEVERKKLELVLDVAEKVWG